MTNTELANMSTEDLLAHTQGVTGINPDGCPACSSLDFEHINMGAAGFIRTCKSCSAVFGELWWASYQAMVNSRDWATECSAGTCEEHHRYFDFTILREDGTKSTRHHGWQCPRTGKVTQWG